MNRSHLLISGLCGAIASLALATGAQAQSNYSLYGSGHSYIGFNAGQTDFRLGNGTGLYNADSRDTSYGLYAGSYFRDSNLGMEVGYTDFGKVRRAGGSTRADGYNLSLIGRLPMSSSFNLLGKIGGLYAHTDVSAGTGSGVSSGTENNLDWTWGVGAEYAFTRQWAGVLQYDENTMKFAGGGTDRITNLAVGVRYLY